MYWTISPIIIRSLIKLFEGSKPKKNRKIQLIAFWIISLLMIGFTAFYYFYTWQMNFYEFFNLNRIYSSDELEKQFKVKIKFNKGYSDIEKAKLTY